MVEGLIGNQGGNDPDCSRRTGRSSPVTMLEAGPCVVVQLKTAEQGRLRGGAAGSRRPKAAKRANKPAQGHHEKAGVPPTRMLREFRVEAGTTGSRPETTVLVDIFEDVDKVDVVGTSKGKGFQGVMKRHGFGGGKRDPRIDVPSRARARSGSRPSRRRCSRGCAARDKWAPDVGSP